LLHYEQDELNEIVYARRKSLRESLLLRVWRACDLCSSKRQVERTNARTNARTTHPAGWPLKFFLSYFTSKDTAPLHVYT